jgi:hypothetical protein
MKVTLISLDRELLCIGIRLLSACLRKAGHETRLVFLIPPEAGDGTEKYQIAYPEALLARLADLAADSGLVGISLMSNQFVQAAGVSRFLKPRGLSAPLIWGGVQPTVEPEECMHHADMICVGEGEEAVVELADRMERGDPYDDVRNIWLNTERGVVRNPLRPLLRDLDALPFPDYSCEGHFVAAHGDLAELTRERFLSFRGERFHGGGTSIPYMLMTGRG